MELKTQKLIEKWRKCPDRYPVLIIVPSNAQAIDNVTIKAFANVLNARILDFEIEYEGKLSEFVIWQRIQSQIFESALIQPTIVVNAELFYDKWTKEERLSFLRSLLRKDGHRGIVLVIYCNEYLSKITEEISESDRGVIWSP